GILHEDLRLLLDTSLPAKRKKVLLGVGDPKIGAAILEELGCQCQTGGVVAEILRGEQLPLQLPVQTGEGEQRPGHAPAPAWSVPGGTGGAPGGQAGLRGGRAAALTPARPRREWYGYHFPELIKLVPENAAYCRLARFIGNRRELGEERLEGLEEIVMDGAKARAILEASRSSMGMDISPLDLINIESFSRRVISLSEYRAELQEYLRSKMSQVAPSLSALIGEVVGARLISHAGSLTNLAKYPASTVQILGAEKALFRYRSGVVAVMAGPWAAGCDGSPAPGPRGGAEPLSPVPTEVPTSVFGDKLREQVEERLAFYETGEPPRKNLEVMKEAVLEASEVVAEVRRKQEKKEKKRQKREKRRLEALAAAAEEAENAALEAEENNIEPKKKKKKKKQQPELGGDSEQQLEAAENGLGEETLPKRKRKRRGEAAEEEEEEERKKKKRKKVKEQEQD
ncbi:NOP56 protein, partial [Chordeiles acutipennis]|nr:NOP56 protein [Chordeiles acutipennis]